jgi:hypothetical protein
MALSGVSVIVTQHVMTVTALTVCVAIISAKVTAITALYQDMWVHAWTFRIGKTPGGPARWQRGGLQSVELSVIQGNVHSLIMEHPVVYVQRVMGTGVAIKCLLMTADVE